MKNTDTLTTMFRHNLWANMRILERCAELNNEQLNTAISGTFGSIHGTLQHIVSAERSYFSRISTGEPHRRSNDEPPMTFEEMMESARISGTGFVEWAPKVQVEDTVLVNWEGEPREVPKTIILTQVINHATEHRAQIMATMTQLGIQPPELDSWTFFNEYETSLLS